MRLGCAVDCAPDLGVGEFSHRVLLADWFDHQRPSCWSINPRLPSKFPVFEGASCTAPPLSDTRISKRYGNVRYVHRGQGGQSAAPAANTAGAACAFIHGDLRNTTPQREGILDLGPTSERGQHRQPRPVGVVLNRQRRLRLDIQHGDSRPWWSAMMRSNRVTAA
jgi:hypothetical protein